MATTRAQVETILIRRAGKWLIAAGLDGTTISGSNVDLNDPLGFAIRACGGTVASIASVADADLATVPDSDLDKLLDIAELRTLESILGNYRLVDAKAGPVEAKASQLADRLERAIARLRSQLAIRYGIEGSSLSAGVIMLSIAETNL